MNIDYKVIGKVIASDHRLKVISILSEGARTPIHISKALNLDLSHISKTIHELESLGLVECKNPELRKGRLYSLTTYGEQVLHNVNMLRQDLGAKKGVG